MEEGETPMIIAIIPLISNVTSLDFYKIAFKLKFHLISSDDDAIHYSEGRVGAVLGFI